MSKSERLELDIMAKRRTVEAAVSKGQHEVARSASRELRKLIAKRK